MFENHMHRDTELQQLRRCASSCQYGHCRMMAEPWFTRVLRLERKRTERSGKPFILVLMDIQELNEVNGDAAVVIHQILSGLASFTRETDITGWYVEGRVMGTIFTELGETKQLDAAVDSIRCKIVSALKLHLGQEKAERVGISCHVFPDDWSKDKPDGRADSALYPDLRKRSQSKWLHSGGKRIIDILGSTFALVAFLPILLLVAIAIKLTSKGSVLFRQERIGQFGKRFTFFKFRSMHVSNEAGIHEQYVKELIAGTLGEPTDGVFKIQNDPRVTRVGRLLRKTSLDELPQFWNVLKGEMSLVGPRPPLPYEVGVYHVWHRRRVLEAKPGITGLWQVNGRSRTRFDEMVRLDLQYARSSSLWLDLKILLSTPGAVIAGNGAY
jgi:lipopolysaccharide/colanic/teichoic acid biosynthesis glycosyltransferase